MERCEAWSVEYNHRAHKAVEACGFKRGGVVRRAAFVNGRKWDGYHFDIENGMATILISFERNI
jgi:RimJ/RimL family protein N-acetyltransferase